MQLNRSEYLEKRKDIYIRHPRQYVIGILELDIRTQDRITKKDIHGIFSPNNKEALSKSAGRSSDTIPMDITSSTGQILSMLVISVF